MPFDVTGKIAFITGADSGIGQGIAEVLARAGADILITFHTDTGGAERTRGLVQAAGRRAAVRRLDVSDADDVGTVFEQAEEMLGVPDILVNNAGVGGGDEVAEMTLDAWDRVIKTDLYGPFYCARTFIRARRRIGGGGKIINVTSVHEAIPSPGTAAYGAAKGGLANLTRSLALELAPDKINVNNIAPGLIRTPMTAGKLADEKEAQAQFDRIPWKRPGAPDEVGHLALYLASEEADYVTGQTFTIDGGLEMDWGKGA